MSGLWKSANKADPQAHECIAGLDNTANDEKNLPLAEPPDEQQGPGNNEPEEQQDFFQQGEPEQEEEPPDLPQDNAPIIEPPND